MDKKKLLTYQYDASVKKILANKKILAWILKECVSEFKDIPVDYIAKRCIGKTEISITAVDQDEEDQKEDHNEKIVGLNTEDNSEREGKIFYDIRFNAAVPGDNQLIHLIINIEAQKDGNPGYPLIKRAVYYASRLISAQKHTVFTKSDYGKIRKVYSIWIEMNVPDEKANTVTEYYICEKNVIGNVHEKHESYDLINVIMIGLGKEDSIIEKSILRLLNVMFSKTVDKKKVNKVLIDEFGISPRGFLGKEINTMCNLGEGLYESAYQEAYQTASEKISDETQTKTWVESAINVMNVFNVDAQQAVDALKIPQEKRQTVLTQIEAALAPV
ncbi:MAG: PD-(D/E)XK nuclease family transposase [Anaerolineaceae bacterium]|nr:PD-(D/E)XK nuclease family transposase [Anaerolineaceae bacterium]